MGRNERIARVVLVAAAPFIAFGVAAVAQAQEVVSILNQKEWSVAGVGIGADEYATCAATDASHADASIWLQVTETPSQGTVNEVAVMHPGEAQATAAVLQVGADRFVLAATSGDSFFATADEGGEDRGGDAEGRHTDPAVRGRQPGEALWLRSCGVSEGLRGPRAALPRACQSLSLRRRVLCLF